MLHATSTLSDDRPTVFSRRNMLVAFALFLLSASVYLTTYSVNTDELVDSWFIFDMTGSLLRYGDDQFDLMAYFEPDRGDKQFAADALYPLFTYDEDMLSVWLSMPLYWLGYTLPVLGIAHVVWLFNVIIAGLAVSLMYFYARLLHFGAWTGFWAALMLAFATALWPYSKTFLQEPVTLLVTLLFGFALEYWRQRRYRGWWMLIVLPLLVFALIHSKSTAFVALVGLAVIALPGMSSPPPVLRRLELPAMAALIAAAVVMALVDIRPLLAPLTAFSRSFDSPYITVAMRTYLFSPNASFWATSPVLLLAIPGAWMLIRHGRTRYVWAALLILLAYTSGYAIFRGVHWYGSVAWPSRFLVPVIAMVLLLVLPVLERAIYTPRNRLWLLPVMLLTVYGVWISWNGISYHWAVYDKLLPPPLGAQMLQGGVAFDVMQAPWFRLPELWGTRPFDIAWARIGNGVIPLLLGFVALTALAVGVWLLRRDAMRYPSLMLGGLSAALVVITGAGLAQLNRDDPLYYPVFDEQLRAAVAVIEAETAPPDIVFLESRIHVHYFFNHNRVQNARLVGLPFQPGEQYSPEAPPVIVSDSLRDGLNPTTPPLLEAAAANRDSLWLLTEFGPFHPWAVRIVERYMAQTFYLLREFGIDASVRLLEYAATTAPDDSQPRQVTDITFDDAIRLDGFTLPAGTTYAPGDPLPVTLFWSAQTPPEYDITIAYFLVDANGAVVAQGQDSGPVGGFSLSSTWQPDEVVQDHRALRTPARAAPGQYRLWLRLYYWTPEGQQILLPVTDGEPGPEPDIAVLPLAISVD